eukprot:TRINITY_DN99167_c0_g1_i1.p1 TRINITY_DN99167_c0_g1~~TRINITY_DN99167_c0_g1_i1.p1  ORF type:complete len:259 (+),score=13.23 TRINITY_DN99167_c0_g1_i1:40-816(+)
MTTTELPSAYSVEPSDAIRTIFCVNFPADFSEREFHNMFQFADGFEQATLQVTNSKLCGFARFTTPQQAQSAAEFLDSRVIDPLNSTQLMCVMAQKNLLPQQRTPTSKRPLEDPEIPTSKRGGDWGAAGYGYSPDLYGQAGYPPRPPPQRFHAGGASMRAPPTRTSSTEKPPCNTVHVSGLTTKTTEQELSQYFSHAPGYKQLKFCWRSNGSPFALVEFSEIYFAEHVINNMAAALPSTDGQPIQLHYAKNPMGVKRV